MVMQRTARFGLGQTVRHREQPFRGMVVDVDAVCAVSFEGDVSPDQPFYQVIVHGENGGFIAYVPEEALREDHAAAPPSRAEQAQWFTVDDAGRHAPRPHPIH